MFVLLLFSTNILLSGKTSYPLLPFSLYNQLLFVGAVAWLLDSTSFHSLQKGPSLHCLRDPVGQV